MLLPLVAVGVTVTAAIAADKEAKGVVAVRQNAMDANGAHVAAIKAHPDRGAQAIKDVVLQAEAIADIALVPDMFPKDSDQPPTNALPSVWEKPDEFKAAAKKVHDLAREAGRHREDRRLKATLAAFAAMGKEGCGGCHDEFPEEGTS